MVIPYIVFQGECAKALAFYQEVFQSDVGRLQTYGDYIPKDVVTPPANLAQWILHGEMEICGGTFWFADEVAEPVIKGTMVKLTITVSTAVEAQRIYDALVVEGQITLPPTQTFYSTFHAGLIDRFGVSWNIVAEEVLDTN